MNHSSAVSTFILPAIKARLPLQDEQHRSALRLFHGFTEGIPSISVDLYGRTLIVHNYSNPPSTAESICAEVESTACSILPWIQSIVHKARYDQNPRKNNGIIIGKPPDTSVVENGVHYAVNLTLNQDSSLYLDTRLLRFWLKSSMSGKTVLNTFSYTGSLGVAAAAGGALRVAHVDLNQRFLDIARKSTELNGLNPGQHDFLAMDFFSAARKFKNCGKRFDCVLLDPPFFSQTRKALIDMNTDTPRLINKVRPIVNDNGRIVVINNALFLSGEDLMASLQKMCAGGYLEIEQTIPVPEDMCGFPGTIQGQPPADPKPFNHPTKIIVLKVKHSPGYKK